SWVKEDTFGQSTHKVIWGIIRQMLLKNESLTPTLIAQKISNLNIKTKDDISIFDYLNAISFSQITAEGTLDNFKELVKLKVLRELITSSDNVKKFVIENKNKEIKEIVSGIDTINNEKIISLYKNINDEIKDIFSDAEQVIEELGNNPPDPNSFIMGPFESINRLYGSLNKKSNITVIGARTGAGKAQPAWCRVMTTNGWKPIGDLTLNDKVIGSDGFAKDIIGIFPQGKLKTFKVTFSDNGKTFCCENHLWTVSDFYQRLHKLNPSVLPLKKIIPNIKKYRRNNFSVPFVSPIQFEPKILKLHPYIMGVYLGNGTSDQSGISFSTPFLDIVDKIRKILPNSDIIINNIDIHYRIKNKTRRYSNTTKNQKTHTWNSINDYGLIGKSSCDKFIPNDYLFSCVEDRLELLRGLMDTDGTINKKENSNTRYYTSSKILANQVKDLIYSLGGRSKIYGPIYLKTNFSIDQSVMYVVSLYFPKKLACPFYTREKMESYIKGCFRLKNRYIVSIDEAQIEECFCIKIKSNDQLYVTDDYLLTHNTAISMYHQVYVAEKYKQPLLWLDFGEMTAQELQMRSIVMMTKGECPLWALETGQWRQNPKWTKIVRDVWQKVKDIKFYYQDTSNMGPQEVISFIRRFSYNKIGRGNPFLVVYDYFKPFETHNYNSPEWKQMGHFMQDIKSFINNELPIPFWGAIQLNRSGITTNKSSDQVDDSENSIGLSDRITQQSSHSFILRFKTMDEIAVEENKFGNMKLFAVKHRHLGHNFLDAVRPVKIGKKFFRNHINLDGGSFYYEDKGD
ncbi:MAG: LAGLIDADG family homing endonuclease, partial [Nanoarchaeota archaeon]